MSASPIYGATSYDYKQIGQITQSSLDTTINSNYSLSSNITTPFELNSNSEHQADSNKSYLEYRTANNSYMFGKQSYTLSKGLIASMYGVKGLQANFKFSHDTATFFYGEDSANIVAADLTVRNLGSRADLMLEAGYFQSDNRYLGITVADKITSNTSLIVETTKNLNTNAGGFLITANYGETQKQAATDISVSYRNIKAGAVSAYCTDASYDNSIGLRIVATHKIRDNLTLTAYRDIMTDQSATNKLDKTNFDISWCF